MTRKKLFSLSACVLGLALPVVAAYQFNTVNPFNSVETSARGINNDRQVVGDFANAALETNCTESGFFEYDHGKFRKIVVPFKGATDTDANGINNDGDIVGNWDTWKPNSCIATTGEDHGYVFHDGKYYKLPDPPNQDGFPDFNAINDEGDIVGVLTPVPSTTGNRGFLFDDGVYHVLDCGKDQTEANGINEDGDIVGECTDLNPTNHEHGFLLCDGTYYLIDFPGSAGTVAYGINDDGDIAGSYTDSSGFDHGFVVKNFFGGPQWVTVDVPTSPDTKVAAINDHGVLAGTATDAAGNDTGFNTK